MSLATLETLPLNQKVSTSSDQIYLPGFSVHDQDSANWLVRKVVAARQYAEQTKAYAAAEIARAEREEAFLMWRYGDQLKAWVDGQLANDDRPGPPRKSINLPAGKVGRRSVAAKLILDNDSVALAWAKTHCTDAMIVEEKLSKSVLNTHFERTGELPDGVSLSEPQEVFYIK